MGTVTTGSQFAPWHLTAVQKVGDHDFPQKIQIHYWAVLYAFVLMDNHFHYAIGDEPFVEATEPKLARLRRGRAQDSDVALPQLTCPIEAIDQAVAAHFGVRPEVLQAHGHTAGVAKFLAVELACRWTGWTHRAIGEHYGRMCTWTRAWTRGNS